MVAKHEASGTLLTFSGHLDTIASHELKLPLRAEVDRHPGTMTCNFHSVTYIGSAVLRLIFEAARETQRNRGIFRVVDCPEDIRRVFALTGMDHLVDGGPGSSFTVEAKDDLLRLFVQGRMDAVVVGEIRAKVRQALTGHKGPIRFNISAVPYAASAFVHLCIDASKTAKSHGADFGIEKAQPAVAQVFRLAGLQAYLLSSV